MGTENVRFIIRLSIACVLCLCILFPVDTHAKDIKASPGEPRKINYCIECHKSLEGKNASIVKEWQNSVHAKTEKKCDLCHGGNPDVNDMKLAKLNQYNFRGKPDPKVIPNFCSRDGCHNVALKQFQRSPHYKSLKKNGQPGCISCHGSHNIMRSSLNIITDKTCSGCHPVEYSREMISLIFTIEKDIDTLDGDIRDIEKKKSDVEHSRERLVKTRSLFHQMVHVFSREEISFTKKIIDLEIDSLKEDISIKKNTIIRLDIIYIFTIIFSFATTFGLGFYIVMTLIRRKKIQ